MSRRPPPRRGKNLPTTLAAPVTVTIERLGAGGDGVAAGPLFIAGALPGEQVRVQPLANRGDGQEAALLEILSASPQRIAAPCRHADICGGCAVQSLAPAAYAEWKQALVSQPLRQAGLQPDVVRPLQTTPSGSRRRATLAAQRRGKLMQIGFHARRSEQVSEIDECLVLHPRLRALVPGLRALMASLLPDGQQADLFVALTDSGVDVALHGLPAPDLAARERLAGWADQVDLARLSWVGPHGAEPIAQRRIPRLSFGGVPVSLPAGAFTQASAEAEAALVALVLQAVGPAKAVADLFSGLGTFSLPLVMAGAKVRAVESEPQAIAALASAAKLAGLGNRLVAEKRDLFTLPLLARELAGLDAVVFDPPRAGAKAQAGHLATSAVPVVVAVSCNPATFARDAAALVAGGYRLDWVQPVDQFHWTGHVELVGRFSR